MLGGAAVVIALTVRAVAFLRHRPSDRQVARFIEERCPELQDRFASATELLRGGQLTALGDLVVRVLAERATPDVADLLATLTTDQIDRMAARFAEKNVDLAKEMRLTEGEAAQKKARYKRVLERAEDWLGDFSDKQESTLQRMAEAQDPGGQFWFDERLRRQRELLDLMRQVQRERPPRERTIALLRDYSARFDLPADPVRLRRALTMRRASAELTVAILAMATPTQRDHAQKKFDDLIHDFAELSQTDG